MVRMAIIGCGAITEQMHLPCLLSMPEVNLVALVDHDRQRSAELAAKAGRSITACPLEALGGLVDAALIATPPDVRPHVVRQVADMGLHMLCEKPMANDVAGCRAMIEVARSARRVLAIGHMFRFYPVRRTLPDLLAKHELGRLVRVEASEGKPYAWRSRTGYTVLRDKVPGGVLFNAGIHTVDSLLWWLGTPSNITYVDDALGGLESNARITCMFPNDLPCTYHISRTCHLPYVFTFHGEAGILSFATNSIAAYSVTMNSRTTRYECEGGPGNELSCWQDQMRDFIDSIQNNRDPLVSGEEGERAMALIEQCYAMKRQRPLPARAPLPGVMW